MNTTSIITYFPVQVTWISEFSPFDMAEEICSLSGHLSFYLYEYGVVTPKIELLIADEDEDRAELEVWSKNIFDLRAKALVNRSESKNASKESDPFETNYVFLKISGLVPYSSDDIELVNATGDATKVSGEEAKQIHQLLTVRYFVKRVYDLAIVANIANPGSLGLSEGIVLQDNKVTQKTDMVSVYQLQDSALLASRIGWPKLQTLSFLQVWDWATGIEGFLDGFGSDPISRALNAFSYLFDQSIELQSPALLWALVGIEALYIKGQGALTQQIQEKAITLLGSPTTFKKKLRQMYDYRSRLIHGDLSFPGRHNLHEIEEGEYIKELSEAIELACVILAATLQELVKRNWKGLSFTYKVSGL